MTDEDIAIQDKQVADEWADEQAEAKRKRDEFLKDREGLGFAPQPSASDEDSSEVLPDPGKEYEERIQAHKVAMEMMHQMAQAKGHLWPTTTVAMHKEHVAEAIVRHNIGLGKVDDQLADVQQKIEALHNATQMIHAHAAAVKRRADEVAAREAEEEGWKKIAADAKAGAEKVESAKNAMASKVEQEAEAKLDAKEAEAEAPVK